MDAVGCGWMQLDAVGCGWMQLGGNRTHLGAPRCIHTGKSQGTKNARGFRVFKR